MESPMGTGFGTNIYIIEIFLRPGHYQRRPTKLLLPASRKDHSVKFIGTENLFQSKTSHVTYKEKIWNYLHMSSVQMFTVRWVSSNHSDTSPGTADAARWWCPAGSDTGSKGSATSGDCRQRKPCVQGLREAGSEGKQ